MTYQEFISAVSSLRTAKSVTGKTYSDIKVIGDEVSFVRETGEEWYIDLHDLYDFYVNGQYFTTTEAKEFGLARKQSPAVAIVRAIKGL